MPIELECSCGKALKLKDEYAGKRIKCPACQRPMAVPAPPAAEDAAADFLLADSPDDAPPRPARVERPEYVTPEPPRPSPVSPQPPKKVPRPRSVEGRSGGGGVAFEEGWFGSLNAGVIGGLLTMVISAVVFFVALAAGWIVPYAAIAFFAGLVAFFRGLFGRDEAP